MSSILALKPGQFSQATGRTAVTLASDRKRGITASAWGSLEPALGVATFMDAVAVVLVERLNGLGVEREHGSAIVRTFAHYWMEACAKIEHNDLEVRNERVFFTVAIVDFAKGIMRVDALLESEMPKLLELIKPVAGENVRILRVDLRELLQFVRMRAEEADMDLSRGSMFYPPDHPEFLTWKSRHAEWAAEMLAQATPDRPRKLSRGERAAFEADLVRVRQ